VLNNRRQRKECTALAVSIAGTHHGVGVRAVMSAALSSGMRQ
jgi:hypothetical protein